MKRLSVALASVVAGGFALAWGAGWVPVTHVCAAQAQMKYSEDIAPIFRGWCVSCHQPDGEGYQKSGLDLRTYEGLMKGTTSGPW